MSENNYEKLGLKETASFDEIQDARNQLLQQYSGDRKRQEMVEAAYDAILMERLRMRQEGKIKVPEGIRFPEKLTPPPAATSAPSPNGPAWLQKLIDRPAPAEILWPAGVFGGLAVLSTLSTIGPSVLQLSLALGVGAALYFLNRKERRFGRSLVLTLTGLVAGLVLGALLSQVALLGLTEEKFITLIAFFVLWLVSCFLR